MLAKLKTFALVGIDAVAVEVEVDAAAGLPPNGLESLNIRSEAGGRPREVRAKIHSSKLKAGVAGRERMPGNREERVQRWSESVAKDCRFLV